MIQPKLIRFLFSAEPSISAKPDHARLVPHVSAGRTLPRGTKQIGKQSKHPFHGSKCIPLLVALAMLFSVPAVAQITVTANQSQYGGFTALPGSVRHINANLTGCTSCLVNWTVQSGSATLSASTNAYPWVDVTVGSTPGSCSITTGGSSTGYVITSTVKVDVRATSVEDGTKYADFNINVCAVNTQVFVDPFYVTLYAGQAEEFQTWVFGQAQANQGTTAVITSQPTGGDGVLTDATTRSPSFTATVAGRYTITFTSTADGTKTVTATVYVTGNAMPYAATPEETEPVDCSVDPALTGHVYTVGAGKTYATIADALTAVNNASDWAGSTVLIYNTDTTGTNPTKYAEYFSIPGNATPTQPFRVCGVPDASGNLPILYGVNATTSSWTTTGLAGLGGVILWPGGTNGTYNSMNPISYKCGASVCYQTPENIIIEGLHIYGFTPPNQYYPPGSATLTTYGSGVAGVTARQGYNHVFRGLDVEHNDNGTLTDFNGNNSGWAVFNGMETWEGNHFHDNSIESSAAVTHQLYIQSVYQLVQFNVIDHQNAGGGGACVKDRGIGSVVRYNSMVQDTGGRCADLVDAQDNSYFVQLDGYMYKTGTGGTNDQPPDILAAMDEAFHQTDWYGNTFSNSTSLSLIHFNGDHGTYGYERPGRLDFYDNTAYIPGNSAGYIFDTDDPNGASYAPYEYNQVLSQNNIIWDLPSGYNPCWNTTPNFIASFATNLIPANWNAGANPLTNITLPISTSAACNAQSGWQATGGNNTSFTLNNPINNHITGISSGNFLTDTVQPFTSGTFVPVAGHTKSGTVLPSGLMPVRFNATVGSSYWQERNTPVTSSAAGIVGGVDATAVVVNSNSAPQMLLLQ